MHHFHELLQQYGDWIYLVVFAWTALEGETFVIIAGLFAQRGEINLEALFISAWLGSMFGDQVFFMLGRKFGTRILKHLPKLKPSIDRALDWLEKYAVAFILSYRFMYGLRNVSGVAVGLSHLPWRKFAIWNAVAAFIWAVAFIGFGYGFSDIVGHVHHKTEAVEDSAQSVMLSVLGLFVLVICIKLSLMYWQRIRARKK